MIDRVASAAGIEPGDLECVAVATGPGGFTGIRAGLAAGQGIALAAGARLVGGMSFAAVAAAVRLRRPARGREGGPAPTNAVAGGRAAGDGGAALLVALDSRRDDFYVQLFAADRTTKLAEPAAVLPDRLASYVGEVIGGMTLVIAGDRTEPAAD